MFTARICLFVCLAPFLIHSGMAKVVGIECHDIVDSQTKRIFRLRYKRPNNCKPNTRVAIAMKPNMYGYGFRIDDFNSCNTDVVVYFGIISEKQKRELDYNSYESSKIIVFGINTPVKTTRGGGRYSIYDFIAVPINRDAGKYYVHVMIHSKIGNKNRVLVRNIIRSLSLSENPGNLTL